MSTGDLRLPERAFERPSQRPIGQQPIGAPGQVAVDYERRVDFDRLRSYRLGRAKASLEASECGAFLLFDFYNIRYTTQTWIGGALGDKMIRYALLIRGQDPILWDFGSAVRHHKLYSDWLPEENYRAGFLGFRGAVDPGAVPVDVRHHALEHAGAVEHRRAEPRRMGARPHQGRIALVPRAIEPIPRLRVPGHELVP